MVKIPIGNGSKNVTLLVMYEQIVRGKVENARNEHIFDAVVGLALVRNPYDDRWRPAARTERAVEAPRLRAQPRLGHGPGQTHKPAGAAQPLHTYEHADQQLLELTFGENGNR